jgi:haloacid dehalogenase-like hydrolase
VGQRKISLVLADVDGTLVTEQKILMERARSAGAPLRSAGIGFAIASGRPTTAGQAPAAAAAAIVAGSAIFRTQDYTAAIAAIRAGAAVAWIQS